MRKKKYWFNFINWEQLEEKLFNKADDLTMWIDYMRVVLREPIKYFDEILFDKGIDWDNSNFYIDEKNLITWTKLKLQTWWCILWSVVYKTVSVPILLYNVFPSDRQERYKAYGRLDIYWWYWRLLELLYLEHDYLDKLVWEDIELFREFDISRLDYKFDLFFNYDFRPPLPWEMLKLRKNVVWEDFKIWEEVVWWTYWSKVSKRVKLRFYDKLVDSQKKWKMLLYKDYFKWQKVYRLEFELLNKFCRWYTYWNYIELVEKFIDSLYIELPTKIFYDYDKNTLLNEQERIRYFKDFIGRWREIAKAGFNPFVILYKWLDWEIDKDKLDNLVFELYSELWIGK